MTPPDRILSLGRIMRDIARALRDDTPMTPEEAVQHTTQDAPYCMMVLMRLELRGFAERTHVMEGGRSNLGFFRGPKWHEVASAYGWSP